MYNNNNNNNNNINISNTYYMAILLYLTFNCSRSMSLTFDLPLLKQSTINVIL